MKLLWLKLDSVCLMDAHLGWWVLGLCLGLFVMLLEPSLRIFVLWWGTLSYWERLLVSESAEWGVCLIWNNVEVGGMGQSNIHMNGMTQYFLAKHCILTKQSMLYS